MDLFNFSFSPKLLFGILGLVLITISISFILKLVINKNTNVNIGKQEKNIINSNLGDNNKFD